MRVRPAAPADRLDVVRVLDAGLLAFDVETVECRIDAGSVLVADADGSVAGAVVADPARDPVRVEAVAVRPNRRGRGVGTALVEAAAERWGALDATFDGGVRPFYESLGFDVTRRGDRLHGVRR